MDRIFHFLRPWKLLLTRNCVIYPISDSYYQNDALPWNRNSDDITTPILHSADCEGRVYNVLLLGETGVGKSTFLNAFMNYIHFSSLEEALKAEKTFSLIPSRFTITDANFKIHDITFGTPDINEALILGEPSTKCCKSYKFTFGGTSIRFVDTPGVVDTRGVEKDEEHLSNLITYLEEIDYVSAILILLKPNESKLTVLFHYCIKRLLSCLDRSATENIIFLFTNSRGTFYRPGDVVQPLRIILNDIAKFPPYIGVPFTATNTFCVDNESFRYLAAKRQGCLFEEAVKDNFAESWKISSNTCDRLLAYIAKLDAHSIKNSLAVMKARNTVERLRRPLGTILEHIEDSIRRITGFEDKILRGDAKISELAKDLLSTQMVLKIRQLENPRTVCTNSACIELQPVEESRRIHYKSICHQPCTLSGVTKEVIGDDLLKKCWAMTDGVCKRCHHSYLEHQHIYYETEPYIETIIHAQTKTDVNYREAERMAIGESLQKLRQQKQELEEEKIMILKAMAKFSHFLTDSAIVSYNDVFANYVRKLIEREKGMGKCARKNVIDGYNILIKAYQEEVNILQRDLTKLQEQDSRVNTIVTTPEIVTVINELYNLKLTGSSIKVMYDAGRGPESITMSQTGEQVIEVRPPVTSRTKKQTVWRKMQFWKKSAKDIEIGIEAAMYKVPDTYTTGSFC